MRKVVVNTTPIISLGNVAHLHIFRMLYGQITIPHAVFREAMAKDDFAFYQLLKNLDWIKLEECPKFNREEFNKNLHVGEIEAIVLAQNLNADLIILDDNNARKAAKNLGLTITGTVGVLLKAKHCGILSDVKTLIQEMRDNGFHLSDKILNTVLQEAGEA